MDKEPKWAPDTREFIAYHEALMRLWYGSPKWDRRVRLGFPSGAMWLTTVDTPEGTKEVPRFSHAYWRHTAEAWRDLWGLEDALFYLVDKAKDLDRRMRCVEHNAKTANLWMEDLNWETLRRRLFDILAATIPVAIKEENLDDDEEDWDFLEDTDETTEPDQG